MEPRLDCLKAVEAATGASDLKGASEAAGANSGMAEQPTVQFLQEQKLGKVALATDGNAQKNHIRSNGLTTPPVPRFKTWV